MLADALAPGTSGQSLDLDGRDAPPAPRSAPRHQPGPGLQHYVRWSATPATQHRTPTKLMAQQQGPTVHLSALLDISPLQCNSHFWASAAAANMARVLDVLFFACALAVSTWATTAGSWARLSWPPLGAVTVPTYLLLGFLQAVGALLEPPFYARLRPQLLQFNRLARLAHAWLNLNSARHCLLSPTCTPPSAPLPTLLLASLAPTSLLQTLFLHLPFRTQPPLQLAHFLLLVAHISPIAAKLISAPTFRPRITALCTTLNSLTNSTLATLSGLPDYPASPHPHPVCTSPHTPWLLVILAQAVAAFLLPLSITYLFERTVKCYYLHHDLNQRHFPRLCLWRLLVACLKLAVVLFLYTLLLWALLRQFHPFLAAWVLPEGWDRDLPVQ